MATELRKLEDTVKEIHSEMMYLRRREEQMRNLNGAQTLAYALVRLDTTVEVRLQRTDFRAVSYDCAGNRCFRLTAEVPNQKHMTHHAEAAQIHSWHAEATNERVAFYSITSLVVCILLGLWQLWHLRSFFQRKKLL